MTARLRDTGTDGANGPEMTTTATVVSDTAVLDNLDSTTTNDPAAKAGGAISHRIPAGPADAAPQARPAGVKEGPMAKRLAQFLPQSLRTLLKDQYLARKYPTLTFGRDVQIKESTFGRHTQIADHVNVYHCTIGDYSYIEVGTVLAYATIGKFCSIAGGTYIGLGVHPSRKAVSTHPAFYSRSRGLATSFADKDYLEEYAPVVVGNDVWIGTAAVIKGGITIGDGAIIGAGAVVTKDVPPYTIVGGVPAKPIRTRFDPETVDFLLKFKWWDKGDDWLKANVRKFHDVQEFVQSLRGQQQ